MGERSSEDELRTRLRQQAAVAELGRHALAGTAFGELARTACDSVSAELGVPYAAVEPVGADSLVRHASVGSAERAETPVGRAEVPFGFGEKPCGLLVVAGAREGELDEDDCNFLQGMANVLAAAIERERVELDLRGSEERFRELANAAPVFIWTADADGMVDFINRGWLEYTGHSVGEELGDSWTVGVHPDDADEVRDTWWRAFSRRMPWECEYRLQREDGAYRWIVDRGVPRFSDDGALLGYVGTATDIDDRKAVEEKLAAAFRRDHEVAETLQRSLLPEHLPRIDGVQLEARYLPAGNEAAIGGDWYDAIERDDGRLAVVVGDVVGHGLRAATVMGQLRNAFRAYALVEQSPAVTLARLNRLVGKDTRELMATALYLLIDRDTGDVRYASAGHPPALVIGPEGARFLENTGSVPLGTADPVLYRERTDRIEPGATLLLYTDGLVERRDVKLDDRLAQLAAVASVADGELGDVCDQILGGVLGNSSPGDDVALMAVRIEDAGLEGLHVTLPAEPAALPSLRRRLGRFLLSVGADDVERYEISLAASEAASNAIEHAYGPADADFELEARHEDGTVVVTVADSGAWRERRGEDRGRGLRIMDGLMDSTEVIPGSTGTRVVMRRRIGSRVAAA
jgi:PAS domain S-box-containing protein